MKEKMKRRSFKDLLEDDRIKEWYEEMCYTGSELTAKVYVRRLFNFQKKTGISPSSLIEDYDVKGLYKVLLDFAKTEKAEGKAPSYIHSELKSLYSWLKTNRVEYEKIPNPKGMGSTPTLKDEVIPTPDQLKKIFMNAPNERDRVSAAFMAFSGVRPAVLCNHTGSNGLRIRDMPELMVSDEEVTFKEMPALIKVHDDLSKTNHDYITFLCEEGCEYLRNYLTNRLKSGEKISLDSPIIKSEFKSKNFLVTKSLRTGIRKAMRGAGLNSRPYVLRRYFASKLLEAENKNEIPSAYSQFFMGHAGNMLATYTTNKGLLPSQLEEMREAYTRCQKYLQTTFKDVDKDELKKSFKRTMLSMLGFNEEEVSKIDLDNISDEEISQQIIEKFKVVKNNQFNKRKKIVSPDQGKYLLEEENWDFVEELRSGDWIMRPPE